MADIILEFKDICVDFPLKRGVLCASDNVTLAIKRGEIMGIVGESGSGKSTLACTALNLVSPPGSITNGQVLFEGDDILKYPPDLSRQFNWRNVSMIFQAAQNSMNPILRVKDIFLETVKCHDSNARESDIFDKAVALMKKVRLNPEQVLTSYPHQLSGGMKQRTIIALSLILDPKVLILDEPTTALDVITQAYIMNILMEIHKELGVTMVFNTHDVAIISKMADRVAVMYGGQIVELGTTEELFYETLHPYSIGLINAAPSIRDDITQRRAISGTPPDLISPPPNCRFAPRCQLVIDGKCKNDAKPELVEYSPGHFVRCLLQAREAVE
jgi:peptide/nickel transport system ATP-binding protein